MEVQFKSLQIQGLKDLLGEVENAEQTQELRLGDGMPDVGRVIAAWGQSVLRSKEWHADYVLCSCGMLVWVLYEPEGEETLQVLNTWIPFQIRWELPPEAGEGQLRISLLTRFVDARSVSPRKIMVRAGMSALAEALVPEVIHLQIPEQETKLPMLVTNHTVQLQKEAGEKTFSLDEELRLPQSLPIPEKILYCTMESRITDARVLADKLSIRGQGKLHILYQSPSGQVHSWDFDIPFAQFAQLRESYGSDAGADVRFALTSLEPELQEEGRLRLKCGLAGQYVIRDKESFSILEDAYHPNREVQLHSMSVELPAAEEPERKIIPIRSHIQTEADLIPDVCVLPDFPLVRKNADQLELSIPGSFQVLYYAPDDKLRAAVSRWEEKELLTGKNCRCLYPQSGEIQPRADNAGIDLQAQLELSGTPVSGKTMSMVTALEIGQESASEGPKPSVILLRFGKERLWDIAKRTGSTVEAIQAANGLDGACEPGKLLLIPVR